MKAARRSPGRIPLGTCTTPDSLSPADGKVTACSVIRMVSVGAGSGGRLYPIDARMEAGLLPRLPAPADPHGRCKSQLALTRLAGTSAKRSLGGTLPGRGAAAMGVSLANMSSRIGAAD